MLNFSAESNPLHKIFLLLEQTDTTKQEKISSVIHSLLDLRYINTQNAQGKTLLHILIEKEFSYIITKLLEKESPYRNIIYAVDNEHRCALHYAAKVGNDDIFNFILKECLFFINHQNINKQTPLHYAARYHNENATNLLLQHGAILTIKDKAHLPAIAYAKEFAIKKIFTQYYFKQFTPQKLDEPNIFEKPKQGLGIIKKEYNKLFSSVARSRSIALSSSSSLVLTPYLSNRSQHSTDSIPPLLKEQSNHTLVKRLHSNSVASLDTSTEEFSFPPTSYKQQIERPSDSLMSKITQYFEHDSIDYDSEQNDLRTEVCATLLKVPLAAYRYQQSLLNLINEKKVSHKKINFLLTHI